MARNWLTEREKTRAAQWASLIYQAMLYLSLCRELNFSKEQLTVMQKGQEKIAKRISDMSDDYDVFSMLEELKEYGVELNKEDFERIFSKPL